MSVRDLARDWDVEARNAAFALHRWTPADDELPKLCLDDVSAIPFLTEIVGVEEYQHRARVRSDDGDVFACVTRVPPGYEEYCRVQLGLGQPRPLLAAVADAGPLAVARACQEGDAYSEIVEHARAGRGLVIHPYMSIESVWDLAAHVGADAEVPVKVLGPPPPVLWIANDKATFSSVVSTVLDESFIVETHTATESRKIAEALCDIAGRCRRVALKRTRAASSMGNIVYDSAALTADGIDGCLRQISPFLERTQWEDGAEEVLAVAWMDADYSPSTQIWIPPLGHGPPRLDGIYVQILEGEEQIFVGSRPTTLPQPVNDELARTALEVAAAFQELGYVGRCSFDHLVLGDPQGEFRVVFTECNGRWGGTSTPMHLVDRLMDGNERPPYRAQDFIHDDLVGVPFVEVLERVGDEAYDTRTGKGRFVFYNVGPLGTHGKLDVIALAKTQEEAEAALEQDLPRLLGL